MDWETHKKILLKDPEFRKALEETRLEYEVAREIIRGRIRSGLTQAQLAKKLKTRQSVISRAESASSLPSLSFLRKMANALGTSLHVQFK
ncbi:MAG: helix-turn-helix transcriptional regulator [Patescibacteria group bacterium]